MEVEEEVSVRREARLGALPVAVVTGLPEAYVVELEAIEQKECINVF